MQRNIARPLGHLTPVLLPIIANIFVMPEVAYSSMRLRCTRTRSTAALSLKVKVDCVAAHTHSLMSWLESEKEFVYRAGAPADDSSVWLKVKNRRPREQSK